MRRVPDYLNRNGQVMILSVLAIGATLLAATAVGGFILVYQIRQTTDFEDSARAIAAADAGIEYGLYNHYCLALGKNPCPYPAGFSDTVGADNSLTFVANGARFTETLMDPTDIKSTGYYGTTKRAFIVDLTTATATVP